MREENKHIIYTANDIKRYITGDMSPAEMHAIEMAALDDPLLAEAMEGYELMEQKDWSKELAALKQTFNKNEKDETPVIPLYKKSTTKWWKAAAAILVLGTTATTAYIFTNKNKEETTQIAKTETAATDSLTIATTEPSVAYYDSAITGSNQQLIAKLDKNAKQDYTATPTVEEKAIADNNVAGDNEKQVNEDFVYKPSAAPANTERKDYKQDAESYRNKATSAEQAEVTMANGNIASNAEVVNNNAGYVPRFKNNKEEATIQNMNSGAISTDVSFNNTANNFYGQVVTTDNKPVSFANINIPQSKKTVYTDAQGRFTITAPDSLLKVTVASAGFNVQKFTLQNATGQNKIVLEPQEIATEMLTTTAKATTKKRQQVLVDSADLEEEEEDAAPAIGWAAYDDYLNNNLILPDDAKKKNIHGEVEVTVRLKNNGEISTIKIDKPLCAGCDAEAIRLVKEGPKWDVKNNKKKKVKVKVKF